MLPLVQEWRSRSAEAKAEAEKAGGEGQEKGKEPKEALEAAINHEHRMAQYHEFDDFLEMALQFGYLTMFSSAFPFAALCAWANNILEIRTDFLKLTVASQRPFPAPAIGIGSWLLAFEFLSAAAVVTNVALIGTCCPELCPLPPLDIFFFKMSARSMMMDGHEE